MLEYCYLLFLGGGAESGCVDCFILKIAFNTELKANLIAMKMFAFCILGKGLSCAPTIKSALNGPLMVVK